MGPTTSEHQHNHGQANPAAPAAAAHHDTGMHMSGGDSMMMSSWFLASQHVTLLVKGWETDNTPLYILSLVALFVLGFLYEALSSSQSWLQQRVIAKSSDLEGKPAAQQGHHLVDYGERCLLSVAYFFKIGVGYRLMLADRVMSFNLGVYFAVVLGMTAGYFLLRSANLVATTCSHD